MDSGHEMRLVRAIFVDRSDTYKDFLVRVMLLCRVLPHSKTRRFFLSKSTIYELTTRYYRIDDGIQKAAKMKETQEWSREEAMRWKFNQCQRTTWPSSTGSQ